VERRVQAELQRLGVRPQARADSVRGGRARRRWRASAQVKMEREVADDRDVVVVKQEGIPANIRQDCSDLIQNLRVLADCLALRVKKRRFDLYDPQQITDEVLRNFKYGIFRSKRDRFVVLSRVFENGAHAALLSAINMVTDKSNRTNLNKSLHAMRLYQWLTDVRIIDHLATLASFYFTFPTYLNSLKWPKDAVIVQWGHVFADAMNFFHRYDEHRE
jgi:hypothetical protein